MATGEKHQHVLKRCSKIMQHFKPVIGVEVGVFAGQLSSALMESYPFLTLYGVDPFKTFSRRPEWEQSRWDDLHDAVIKMMAPYGERWKLLRMASLDAIEHLPNMLDFVYLDGDHSYQTVMAEIAAYEKLIRPGGILGGHDYFDETTGVMQAVQEQAKERGRDVMLEPDVGMWWWRVDPPPIKLIVEDNRVRRSQRRGQHENHC